MHIITKKIPTEISTAKIWSIKSFIRTLLSLSLIATLFVSCGSKAAATNGIAMSKVAYDGEMEAATEAVYEESMLDVTEDSAAATPVSPENRKLIKTGSLSIEVDSLAAGEQGLNNFVKELGGYITDTYSYVWSYSATIKVPADRFEEAMSKVGTLGKTKNRSTNSQDVTDQYYDLKTRIETKTVMQQKFQEYLKQAKDIKDLLEVEKQLNEVTSEIEVMQGQFNRLSNQISYSTIHISFELPTGVTEEGYDWPDFKEDFRDFAANFIGFVEFLVMALFYIVVFGIPIVAVIALFYWLLFGRIGIIRRLFSVISKKKTDKTSKQE